MARRRSTRTSSGSPEASTTAFLTRLVSEHRGAMLRIARRFPGRATTAEDIVQEAFVESLPQGAGLQYVITLLLLCLAEQEACFDVCADQAEALSHNEQISEGDALRFYEECTTVCWQDCFDERPG